MLGLSDIIISMNRIIIHSKFVTDLPEVSQTYYFLRGLAANNCGWVKFNLKSGAAFLSRSTKTIKKRLKKGVQLGVFQEVRPLDNQGNYFVKLRSYKKIEEELVGYSFAAAEISLSDVADIKLLKERAYEIAIFCQQLRTEGAIHKKHKKVFDPRKTIEARLKDRSLKDLASKTVNGFPNFGRGNNFFVNSNTQAYGASQTSVAHELNRSRKTVSKHVQNLERVNIWRKVKEEKRAHYIFFNHVTKKETYYERLPNYYLPTNLDVRCRGTNPTRRINPIEVANQQERDIDYILSLKKPARRTLEAKLIDMSAVKIQKLASEIFWFFKGVDMSERIKTINPIELMLSIVHSTEDGSLSKGQVEFVNWLIKKINKGQFIRHSLSWQALANIA